MRGVLRTETDELVRILTTTNSASAYLRKGVQFQIERWSTLFPPTISSAGVHETAELLPACAIHIHEKSPQPPYAISQCSNGPPN